MLSKNLKRKIAVLLTGVMVFGMTITAGAAVNGGDGVSSEGTGNFEGHVNRKVVNVTLPTVSQGTLPFNFVYDAEGLIPDTSAAAYGDDFNFASARNVYFKTADKTYGGESTPFTVSNNSSVSVNVTLKIDVTAGGNDPALVDEASLPDDYDSTHASGDPSLYLGLVVDGDATGEMGTDDADKYSISENTITKTFNLEGEPANYTVSVNKIGEDGYPHEYKFLKKETPTNPWKAITFKLEGKANKVDVGKKDGKLLTAPKLNVTWNFTALDEDAEAGEDMAGGGSGGSTSSTPAKSSVAPIVVGGSNATAAVTVGQDGAEVTSVTTSLFSGNMLTITNGYGATYNSSTKVITFDTGISEYLAGDGSATTFTVTFTPAEGEAYTATLAVAE